MAGFFQRLKAANAYMFRQIYKRAGVLPPELQRQVDALRKISANLYEVTSVPNIAASKSSDAPIVLKFRRPDSLLRYRLFCLSAVFSACGHRMSNPDAVLQNAFDDLMTVKLSEQTGGEPGGVGEKQKAYDESHALVEDFLNRWPAWAGFRGRQERGSVDKATSVVVAMLRMTESTAPAAEEDIDRLWPLAVWIERTIPSITSAFSELSH